MELYTQGKQENLREGSDGQNWQLPPGNQASVLMIKQSFVALSGIPTGIQWVRSQRLQYLEEIDAANRMVLIHCSLNIYRVAHYNHCARLWGIATSITDLLYPILMSLYSRLVVLFCLERGLLSTNNVRGLLLFKRLSVFKCLREKGDRRESMI